MNKAKEVQALKAAMERKIHAAVTEFMDSTGTYVSDISIYNKMDTVFETGTEWSTRYVAGVVIQTEVKVA